MGRLCSKDPNDNQIVELSSHLRHLVQEWEVQQDLNPSVQALHYAWTPLDYPPPSITPSPIEAGYELRAAAHQYATADLNATARPYASDQNPKTLNVSRQCSPLGVFKK